MVKTKEKTTQAINIFGKEIVLTKLGCPVISIRNDDKIDVRITTPIINVVVSDTTDYATKT